jgi:hypothetical protein
MLYFPSTLGEWTNVVRAAYPTFSEAQRVALAETLMRRHPGHPDVVVQDGEIAVGAENATVADGWERISA